MKAILTAASAARRRLRAWRHRLDSRFILRARRAARGRKYLITGATSGIGEAAAAELLRCGASVLIHGRSPQRLAQSVARLQAQARHGARIWSYCAELADPRQIEHLLQQVRQDHSHLDGLINNAAIGVMAERRVDARGLEWLWAVNVVAPWHLAHGLAETLARGHAPRILNLASSLTHEIGDDLMLEHNWDPIHAYGRSKQAVIVLTVALAEQLQAQGIVVNALDPGSIDTAMFAGFELDFRGMPVRQAGELLGRMIADPVLSETSGSLFRIGRPIELPPQALDVQFRTRLTGTLQRQAAAAA